MPSRHRAGRKPEPRAAKGAIIRSPKAPAYLTDEAKAAWKRVVPEIIASSAVTAADLLLVENYVVALGRVRELERAIQAGVDIDPRLFRMQDAASKTAIRYAAELYSSPASRSRPSAQPADDADDLADLGLGA